MLLIMELLLNTFTIIDIGMSGYRAEQLKIY